MSGNRPDFDHFIAANEHGFYCVPSAFAGREVPDILANGGIYEPATLRLMTNHCKDGDIVTGGAFVGDFFPALARGLAPGARLHSFEPHPDSFAAAAYTVKLNALDCVDLHPVAVGAEVAELPLQITRRKGQLSLAAGARIVSEADAEGGETIRVPVQKLDDLVSKDRKVSILHLDIEGHEMPAIRGSERIITQNAPILVIEAGRPRRRRAILSLLSEVAPDLGYEETSVIENNAIFLPMKAFS